MDIEKLGAGVFTIDAFLSEAECSGHIARSEGMGYQEAAISTDDGDRFFKDTRNNDRIIFDDPALAQALYLRARPALPPELDGWQLSGFNERFRFYRYHRDQQFNWHQDGSVRPQAGRESFLTFLIYLNDGFEGGSTDFQWDTVRPATGRALVFPHRLRHRGAMITSGTKYVLRTDVMYDDPQHDVR